jgi:hypothetical protein
MLSTSLIHSIPQGFISMTIFDIVLNVFVLSYYPVSFFTGTKSTSIDHLMILDRGRYGT